MCETTMCDSFVLILEAQRQYGKRMRVWEKKKKKKTWAWLHAPNVRSHLIYLYAYVLCLSQMNAKSFEQRIKRKVFFYSFVRSIHLVYFVYAFVCVCVSLFFSPVPKCKFIRMGTWQMLFRHTCVESTVDVLTWRKMVFFVSWNCKIALHDTHEKKKSTHTESPSLRYIQNMQPFFPISFRFSNRFIIYT